VQVNGQVNFEARITIIMITKMVISDYFLTWLCFLTQKFVENYWVGLTTVLSLFRNGVFLQLTAHYHDNVATIRDNVVLFHLWRFMNGFDIVSQLSFFILVNCQVVVNCCYEVNGASA
jgi:hypothetical protein